MSASSSRNSMLIYYLARLRPCVCSELSSCQCASTSISDCIPDHMTAPIMTSFNIIRDILLGRHTTCSRVSVFHSDLPSLKRSLELHAIPISGMSLTQCRRVLLQYCDWSLRRSCRGCVSQSQARLLSLSSSVPGLWLRSRNVESSFEYCPRC